jgi:hypothetical protein
MTDAPPKNRVDKWFSKAVYLLENQRGIMTSKLATLFHAQQRDLLKTGIVDTIIQPPLFYFKKGARKRQIIQPPYFKNKKYHFSIKSILPHPYILVMLEDRINKNVPPYLHHVV